MAYYFKTFQTSVMSSTPPSVSFEAFIVPGVSITSASISVYQISLGNAILMNSGTTSSPNFQLNLSLTPSGYYYITMKVLSYTQNGTTYETNGRNITLLAVFDGSATNVCVSAQTTVAATYCFARLISYLPQAPISIYGNNRSLKIAYGMKNNFVHTNGDISPVISSSPNALETNSYPLFNFLGNLLYYCLTDAYVYDQFLALAGGSPSVFEGLLYLVYNPFTNVAEIYALISSLPQVLTPSLPTLTLPGSMSPQPSQWTLTIKANDSGAKNFLIAGAAFAVFDKEDKAWIANNCRAGSPDSGTHCIVLNSDGSPANISPITGGGILGPGFGIAIDDAGETIAIGNFGWGQESWNPQQGSISVFKYDGTVVSPPNGFTNKLSRVQALCYDRNGNLWMSSIGTQQPMPPGTPPSIYNFEPQNSAIVVYIGGDPNNALSYDNFLGNPSPFHNTFDVVIDSQGNAFVSCIGKANVNDTGLNVKSSVHKMALVNGELQCLASWESTWEDTGCEELRQVTVNANDEVFVVAITSSRVIKLDNNLNYIGQFTTNIHAPWGITFDKAGTMFVANFGNDRERNPDYDTLDMKGPFGVTMIRNEDDSTASLMTVPTGGFEVMLRNGSPLYGNQQHPTKPDSGDTTSKRMRCYEPIMRLTSTSIDKAGNLWAMNNWKPSAYVDLKDNPGADGVVIYVGVAAI